MNTNTEQNTNPKHAFDSIKLQALKDHIKQHDNVLIKRSRLYKKAVVVGVVDEPGSLIISHQPVEADPILGLEADVYWLVHMSEELTPKELAGGVTNFHELDEVRIYSWHDLKKFLANWCSFRHHQ